MPAPEITIAPLAAKRVLNFDCWVFRDELVQKPPGSIENGSPVELIDSNGTFLAHAFYSTVSHIAARVISRERAVPPSAKLLDERIRRAIKRRETITGTDAKRLISSEADELPGWIVDQYGPFLVLQIRSAGMEAWREALLGILKKQLNPQGILERSDKEFRSDEGLTEITATHLGQVPERIRITENGLTFLVDPHHGHKTGFYLDQRETRRWVFDRIQPGQRVLDVFAYTGAFGIGAAARGANVVSVERQEDLQPFAREQAELNGVSARMQHVTADAFYWLEAKKQSQEKFDWVLLDPPGLAKGKADLHKARQALHHLLVNALPLLNPNGTLVLSICTYHLLGVAEEIIRIAASACKLRVSIRAVTMQAEDHPWILQIPATRYLVTWMVQRAE